VYEFNFSACHATVMGLHGMGVDSCKLGVGWGLALARAVALSTAMFIIGMTLSSWRGKMSC